MAKQHQKLLKRERDQTIAEPDAPDAPALMPDPEPLITTETTLPAAMKIEWWSTKTTDRKCMTTGGGTSCNR